MRTIFSPSTLPDEWPAVPPSRLAGRAATGLPVRQLAQLRAVAAGLGGGGMAKSTGSRRKFGSAVIHFAGGIDADRYRAAQVLAASLGLDLHRVDLGQIVGKYVGETEKNLMALFRAAVQQRAILYFDEADALFGRRSEVSDAHDRYANLETAFLLRIMARFGGIAILSTGCVVPLCPLPRRRLRYVVTFT